MGCEQSGSLKGDGATEADIHNIHIEWNLFLVSTARMVETCAV